jgi:NAD(P)-dependent dehydrogenase (short-subunit alcohol dehydrogenase family)
MSVDGLFSVTGKTALVTGGARGVGLMLARGFVEAGADVYIASEVADECRQAAADLSGLPGGGSCVALAADLSTDDGCRGLARAVKEREDKLDILINNAGIPGKYSARRLDHQVWRQVFAINLEAGFHLVNFLLPQLKAASREGEPARVLNMGSIAGIETSDVDTYAYTSSKAAVHHLTVHLARVLAPKVTVNALAPGYFPSKMMKKALGLFGEALMKEIPLGRIGGPADIVGTAIFLSSRAGSFVTGTVIPVDGGASTTT